MLSVIEDVESPNGDIFVPAKLISRMALSVNCLIMVFANV